MMRIQLLQEHDLTKRALCVGGILKCVEDLLQCDSATGGTIDGLPYDAVCLEWGVSGWVEMWVVWMCVGG